MNFDYIKLFEDLGILIGENNHKESKDSYPCKVGIYMRYLNWEATRAVTFTFSCF